MNLLAPAPDCQRSGSYHQCCTIIIDIWYYFQMNVLARDFGTPQLQTVSAAVVTINVVRNDNGPVFQNIPYNRGISQNTVSGTSVFQVTATDADTVRF